MKLRRLHIKSFRNIASTTLELEENAKFVCIRGGNRNGKTSLAESLSIALTNTAWGLSAKGDGYARKIKRGEKQSVIEVDLQGANRTIRRTATLNFSGRTQSSVDVNDPDWLSVKFDKLLSDKKAALGVAINTRDFMALVYSRDEAAQKSLLAQLVLPAHYDFPKDTIANVESVLGVGTINFDGEPFNVIESAYKKLYKEREDSNRRVKEFSIPDALPAPKGVDSISLQTQLADLRGMRVKQSAERDTASKQANEGAVKQARTKARIETLEAVLKANKEALRSLEANILADPSAVQELASKKPEQERLLGEQQRLLGEQEAAKKQQARINQLSGLGSTCPTCDQDIEDSRVTKLMEGTVTERTRLTEEYVKATQAMGTLGDVDGAITMLQRHKKAIDEKVDLLEKIDDQTKELIMAKNEADKDAGGLFDSSTFDQTISETDRKIEAIIQQIQPVIAAEERAKDIATKTEQLKRLEDKAAKLDGLVGYFDKNGIKAKLIAQYIGAFEHSLNRVLDAWGYKCSLSIEPYQFLLIDTKGVSTPLIEVSGAEELFFYAAMQCAVSNVAGIGFVVIDRVDTLLPDIRPQLYKKLYSMITDGHLEQVILLCADTSTTVPSIPNSAFFMVEGGNIRRLS